MDVNITLFSFKFFKFGFLKINPLLMVFNLFFFIPFSFQNSDTDLETQIMSLEK